MYVISHFVLDDSLNINPRNIIFNIAHPNSAHIVNSLVLITKQYIYRIRCVMGTLRFVDIINEYETIEKYERHYAGINRKMSKHYRKWATMSEEYVEALMDMVEN